MKRKVAKAVGLRLSPNEEAQLLKEEHERRRKLRLQQVREQEKNIALQIRRDVKQRRDEQLHHLAEELKAEWQRAQNEKIQALEKLYLSSLRAIGEGHRQAKENEPDLEALAKLAKERKQRAEKRHKEALKEQKNKKEKLLREQTRRTNARKNALDVEKERAAKIASLPPPPPPPFENIELKSVSTVKVCDTDTFSITRHHLCDLHHLCDPYVDREMNIDQPDARLLAKVEAKRKEGLQSNEERERREQQEKARLRGKHALKMVRLARDREKLMKELEHMQNMDLARRRQIVAQMPPQLFLPPYKRVEIREEWQRELECAFEDMYTGDRKMKGDLILHLDPQPLPTFTGRSQDDELELSQEPGSVFEVPPSLPDEVKDSEPSSSEVEKPPEPQSKLALKKLLNKIRNQKDHWTTGSEPEITSEIESIESGTISSRERRLYDSESEPEPKSDPVSEAREPSQILDQSIVAGNVGLDHPQEQVTKLRKEAERQNQIEHLKQQQLALLQQIEQQKNRLEADFLKAQMQRQEQEFKKEQEMKDQESQMEQVNIRVPFVHQQQEVQHKVKEKSGSCVEGDPMEDDHIQMIRDYQQRLLIQNRMHRASVEEARKRLHEYQNKLKQRYRLVSASLRGPANRLAQQDSLPDVPSQLQGYRGLQRVNLAAEQPFGTAPVQESAEHSKLPWMLAVPSSEQGGTEQRFDVGSGHVCTLEGQRPFQLSQAYGSHQQTEKLGAVETPSAQSLEFHSIPESLMLKSQDTSVTTQPVAETQRAPFTFPVGSSSVSSETLWSDKLTSHAPPAEKILLPATLKHQHIPPESWTRTTLEQAYLPPLRPLSPVLSFVSSESQKTQESYALKNGIGPTPGYSDIVELRDRMMSSSESIQAQQEHLKELQKQLDKQRESLLSRQKVQEDLLMKKHTHLKQQMEQQQEALKEFIKKAGQSSTCRDMTEQRETDDFHLLPTLGAKDSNEEVVQVAERSSHAEKDILFHSVCPNQQIERLQDTWGREQTWRLSKPPLSKIKLGLDLEQHELSVIPELDTPRSGRLSSTGYREPLTGDTCLASRANKWQSSISLDEDLHEETDLLRITADGQEPSSDESEIQFNDLWCDKSAMEAGGLCDSAHSYELTLRDGGLRSADDTGKIIATYPDPSFSPDCMVTLSTEWCPSPLSPQTSTQQVACGYFSSASLSATSFIANSNPDGSLANTESHSGRKQPGHFSSPLKEKANTALDPSVSLLCKQDDPSEASGSHLFGEMLHSDRHKIQQIIDKYTRDFSWSSLSNVSSHDPAVDTTDLEKSFPNFHRELFKPLEPRPDFDMLSTLSQNSKNLSKNSTLLKSHELTASSLEEGSNNLSFLSTGKLSDILPTQQRGEEAKEQSQGAEESFEHVPLQSSLREFPQSGDKYGSFHAESEQNLEMSKTNGSSIYIAPERTQCEEQENDEITNLYSSIENFRSPSLAEDGGSFYQLVPDNGTRNSALGTTESEKEDMSTKEESLCFAELPTASTDSKCKAVTEKAAINEDVEIHLSQCTLQTTGDQSSLITETMQSLTPEMNSKISVSPVQNSVQQTGSVPDAFQQPNLTATQAESSRSSSSRNVPVWETVTGQGIMEEPELTLISSNDISIAESDLEFFGQAESRKEKTENLSYVDHPEAISCPMQSREFLPLNSEVDDSICSQPDYALAAWSTQEDSCQNSKEEALLPEFTSATESLQEAFFRRKKDFIERSCKRVEKIKSRKRSSEKPPAQASQKKEVHLHKPRENLSPPGAAVVHLKKVEDFRVCSAEDRKAAETQMYQRTSRLYNNLAEVKTRKQERERREDYAKNRERAKAFQKKTLENLRARKTAAKK
ncbi:centrosomal protein of 295 kDa [Lacerta agilis]|uniref:centrosomal protein of 295 kDa n=1 Tax=Lacerta agilis TaxID=80427 RepID=UPI001419354D|nr:centrosomal protein of 295 kDa [Lacerta agilis]